MHVAFPPHHDDYRGGVVRDDADRDGVRRGSGRAPVTGPGSGRRTAGLTIPDLVHHARDLPVYGNISEMAARWRGSAGAAGSCPASLTWRPDIPANVSEEPLS